MLKVMSKCQTMIDMMNMIPFQMKKINVAAVSNLCILNVK